MVARDVIQNCSVSSDWSARAVSPDEAVAGIRSGMRVFVHGAAATPTPLLDALAAATDLEDVTLYHLHTAGPAPFADPEHAGRFRSVSLFTGPPLRAADRRGPRRLHARSSSRTSPACSSSGRIPLDVALVQLSPPDRHGYCTLGTSVDAARAAVDSAPLVLAEINEQMPRTHGNAVVPLDRARRVHRTPTVRCTSSRRRRRAAVEAAIGELVAELVEDGATLQMGIGAIPDAVLARLGNKHDLGVHTEMFSDGSIDLVEAGVITNRQKNVHPGGS